MSLTLNRTIVTGLFVVIVFTALAHGAVEPWSALLFQLTVAALMLLWAVKAFLDRPVVVIIPQIAWPLAGLIAYGVAQSVTWTDGAGNRQSLSMDVEATRGTALVLCCLLACCLLAANFLTNRERLQTLAKFLTIFGMALAVLALVQHFAGWEHTYWPWPIRGNGTFGPFVNRNHFAAYAELLIAMPVAVIVTRQVRGEKSLPYGVAAMVIGVAAIFTLSRGGMISLFAELMFIAALGLGRNKDAADEFTLAGERMPKRGWRAIEALSVAAVLAAIVGGVIWIGAEPVINRIATGDPTSADLSKAQSFYNNRGDIWQDTWRIIREKPLTGAGLGAFETSYRIYAWDRGTEGIVAQAHNDYLQILADAGVIGGGLALWFLIIVLRATIRGVRHHDPFLAALALGSGAGVFGLLVHSLFDFGMQLPSHAVLFISLSAVVTHIGAKAEQPELVHSVSSDLVDNLMGSPVGLETPAPSPASRSLGAVSESNPAVR